MPIKKKTKPKHLRRSTYRRNYDRIVLSTLELMGGRFSIRGRTIAMRAGVVRQTVYGIFGNVVSIVPTWERDTIDELQIYLRENTVQGLDDSEKDLNNKRTIRRLFMFIAQRKELFVAAAEVVVGHEILRMISVATLEELSITWVPRGVNGLNDDGEAVDIFLETMAVLVWRWCRYDKCEINTAKIYIQKLERLTREAMMRCRL